MQKLRQKKTISIFSDWKMEWRDRTAAHRIWIINSDYDPVVGITFF